MTEVSSRERALLVALADGLLPARRRRREMARLADGPERLARQQRVARALRAGAPAPRPALEDIVAVAQERRAQPGGPPRDGLGGRVARTAVYERGGERIAYTIVSGPPLAPPAVFRDGPDAVAVFESDGHTCVLVGPLERRDLLVELAQRDGD